MFSTRLSKIWVRRICKSMSNYCAHLQFFHHCSPTGKIVCVSRCWCMRIGKYLQFSKMRPEAFNGSSAADPILQIRVRTQIQTSICCRGIWVYLQSMPVVRAKWHQLSFGVFIFFSSFFLKNKVCSALDRYENLNSLLARLIYSMR